MENYLIVQERKLLDAKMWLWRRIPFEGDLKVRDKMFEAFHLISLAVLALEVVNYLTNGEYNEENSPRYVKEVNRPE